MYSAKQPLEEELIMPLEMGANVVRICLSFLKPRNS